MRKGNYWIFRKEGEEFVRAIDEGCFTQKQAEKLVRISFDCRPARIYHDHFGRLQLVKEI